MLVTEIWTLDFNNRRIGRTVSLDEKLWQLVSFLKHVPGCINGCPC